LSAFDVAAAEHTQRRHVADADEFCCRFERNLAALRPLAVTEDGDVVVIAEAAHALLRPGIAVPGLDASAIEQARDLPIRHQPRQLTHECDRAVLLHRSVFGRYLFAVGRNEEAARYSGIQTGRVVAAAYVICGALAGLSSIFLTMYTRSISPASHGNFYELYGIAAAVLGGCSLRGGEGSIVGIVLGTILLQILQNLVNLLGIPSSLNFAVMGAVILIGVLADQQFNAYRERKIAGRAGKS
jgi:hypothetical protein